MSRLDYRSSNEQGREGRGPAQPPPSLILQKCVYLNVRHPDDRPLYYKIGWNKLFV